MRPGELLGVKMAKREGNVGESGVSMCWVGVFFGCCRGGMIWAGRWD